MESSKSGGGPSGRRVAIKSKVAAKRAGRSAPLKLAPQTSSLVSPQVGRSGASKHRSLEHEPCLPGMEPEPVALSGGKASRARALLFGSPREVLARISAGDPLHVRSRVGRYLFEAHELIDADRLHLRALAHCARKALHLRASDGFESFLRARVADAAAELIREDREALRNRNRTAGTLEELARPLGLDPRRVLAACSSFNEADGVDREAVFELLIRGTEINAFARSQGVTVTEVAQRARRGLELALVALGSRSRAEPARGGRAAEERGRSLGEKTNLDIERNEK